MGESKLRVEEREAGDVTILILAGEMLLDDGDLVFRKLIHDLVEKGRLKILVDLAGVTYIDSSGVGMMAAKLKTARDKGGDIRLMNLTSRGQRLLSLLKLRSTFETFEDETLALRSFERRPHG
jgi:anti-sigma B factor antagonist